MAVSDQSRYELHHQLDQVLGAEHAATLMAHLPPVGWADVATKQDVANLAERMDSRFAASKQDVANLAERMDSRFAAVDGRFAAMEERMDGRFAAMEQHVDERLELFHASIRAELQGTLVSHLRVVMFGMISSVVAVGGLVIAAVKL